MQYNKVASQDSQLQVGILFLPLIQSNVNIGTA